MSSDCDPPPGPGHNDPPVNGAFTADELRAEWARVVSDGKKAGRAIERVTDEAMRQAARWRAAWPSDDDLLKALKRADIKTRAGNPPLRDLVGNAQRAAGFSGTEASRIAHAVKRWWESADRRPAADPADDVDRWVGQQGGRTALFRDDQKQEKPDKTRLSAAYARLRSLPPLARIEVPDAIAGHTGASLGLVEIEDGCLILRGLVALRLSQAQIFSHVGAALLNRGEDNPTTVVGPEPAEPGADEPQAPEAEAETEREADLYAGEAESMPDAEARLVRLAQAATDRPGRRAYVEGCMEAGVLSPHAIADRANADGVPAPRGGRWNPSTAYNISIEVRSGRPDLPPAPRGGKHRATKASA